MLATQAGGNPGSNITGQPDYAYALNGVSGSHNTGITSTHSGHTHSVEITGGGDAETRPKNVYVHYIIKY